MNIALVVPEFPPDTIGGGGPVFESIAMGLTAHGHDVRVLTAATHHGPSGDGTRYPFPIRRVRELPHFTSQFRAYMPPWPQSLRGVPRFLRGADVYHLHGYGTPFSDVLFNFFLDPRRTVFTTHGFLYTVPSMGGPIAVAYGIYDRLFGRRVLTRSACVTAVSTSLAKEAAVVAKRAVLTVPNGFVSLGAPEALDGTQRAEVEKGPYLLGVGRLEKRKGFELLVRAAARVCSEGGNIRLVLAGADNGEGEALRRLATSLGFEGKLSLVGRVTRPQLATLYADAEATVVSSATESFGLVTLEAMSMGTPCVLAAVGGMLDIGVDGENALMFPVGDERALAERLARLLRSPALRAALISNGKETVKRFTWDAVCRQYEEVYASCARSS